MVVGAWCRVIQPAIWDREVKPIFFQDVFDMAVGCAGCDDEFPGDFLVGHAFGDQVGDLAFSAGEDGRVIRGPCGFPPGLLLQGEHQGFVPRELRSAAESGVESLVCGTNGAWRRRSWVGGCGN
jgi:hypothetical protein